ncbi:MAG TPA: metalloregulator ArsR/SmtB family transcription factor [Gemmatimonadaceae bacterium]|nr:metalloregulator ArsR/SmtB family transcription factor [Gemmatimonadaceae bacterium]
MTYEYVLTALADPTRRAMYAHLRRRPYTVGELAERVAIRQPSASEHLRVLHRAHLVHDRREGTRRYYAASTEGLEALHRWLESMWDDVLSAYADAGEAPARPRPTPSRKRRP